MNNKRFGCFGLVVFAVLGSSLLLNLVLIGGKAASSATSAISIPERREPLMEQIVEPGTGAGRIAQIPIRGLISSGVPGRAGSSMVESVKAQLRQAAEDDDIVAVVLAIDSPGGEVTASDILYNAVRRLRERKPVVVSMGSMATSGGYYIACGGSWLMAHETTFTGSIGVIIQSLRYNDLLAKLGVEPEVFKSGAYKDILSGMREMTPGEKAYIQHLVMESYDRFYGIVARERKLAPEVLRPVADGRIITGKDALSAGLINAIGGVEEAWAKARELGNEPDAPIISYQEVFHIGRLFRFFGSEAAGQPGTVEVNLGKELLPPLEPGRAYLLPSLFVP